MGTLPYFKFWVDDYVGGTLGFSMDMHGAYVMLLIKQYKDGPFTEHTAVSIVGDDLWRKICNKFAREDATGLYYNRRMEKESARNQHVAEVRSAASRTRSLYAPSKDTSKDTSNDISNDTSNDGRLIHQTGYGNGYLEEKEGSGEKEKQKAKKPLRKRFGKYGHVYLTDDEYDRLATEFGRTDVNNGVRAVDEYVQTSGRRYKDYNLVLRRWGIASGRKLSAQEPQRTPHPTDPDRWADGSLRFRDRENGVLWSGKLIP